MIGQHPAGWHPDPYGRYELRFWDGHSWTERVSVQGMEWEWTDPPVRSYIPPSDARSAIVQDQLRRAGVVTDATGADRGLVTRDVLLINRAAKAAPGNILFQVHDATGAVLGHVREVDRAMLARAAGREADRNRTYRFQVVDMEERVLLSVTRPAKKMRSRIVVRDADGRELGVIVQKNIGGIGRLRFSVESGGDTLGTIEAEGTDAADFHVRDRKRTEVARIARTADIKGSIFKKITAGHALQIYVPLEQPFRSLVVAAALTADTVLDRENNRVLPSF